MDGVSINRGNIILSYTSFDDGSVLGHCAIVLDLWLGTEMTFLGTNSSVIFGLNVCCVTGRIWIRKSFWYLNTNICFTIKFHFIHTVLIMVRNAVFTNQSNKMRTKELHTCLLFLSFSQMTTQGHCASHWGEKSAGFSHCWRECISFLRMFSVKFTHNGKVATAHVGPIQKGQ